MSGFVSDVFDILHNFFTIEQSCCFFECLAFGFDEEEEDIDEFKDEPAAVDDIEFPA